MSIRHRKNGYLPKLRTEFQWKSDSDRVRYFERRGIPAEVGVQAGCLRCGERGWSVKIGKSLCELVELKTSGRVEN